MFKRQLSKIDHHLTENDFQQLATLTEGYSGSDLKSLIKEAAYQPMRVFQKATHFKQLNNGKWRPCREGETGGEPMTWLDFPDE
jgi:vacuolar protein-sorting-associated protein 4